MVYENITFYQVVEGSSSLDSGVLLSIIIFCLGIAFGAQWGFNRIYNPERISKFKKFKSNLISNLKFELRRISLKNHNDDKEFDKEVNDFVKDWQNFQDNIKDYYSRLLWWRKEILVVFSLCAISYFIRLIRADLIISGHGINFVSNFLFLIGLFSIFVFIFQVIQLDNKVAKYSLDKPLPEETIQKISSKVLKNKK